MDTGFLLPFAQSRIDGNLVTAHEVPRGLACDCICPGCAAPVIARQGTEREWHFAHSKGEGCENAYEVSIHKLAQQLIGRRKELLLPELVATVKGQDPWGHVHVECEPVFDGRAVALESCRIEAVLGDVTSDVVAVVNGLEILVEVVVFHRLMPDKQDRLVASGHPCFVIDLSEFKRTQVTAELLERAVFRKAGNRYWIFHPDEVDAKVRAHIRLGKKLGALRQKFEATAAERASFLSWDRVQQQSLSPSGHHPRIGDRQTKIPARISSSGPIWRASLPDPEQVAIARGSLAYRLRLEREMVDEVTGEIVRREQLVDKFPRELAQRWAVVLNASEEEMMRYLHEAGYLL